MAVLAAALALPAVRSGAQPSRTTAAAPPAWEIIGIPALNYDADDKVGYGAIVQLYNYGTEGKLPYLLTIQPTVFLTTGGRRDFTLFIDAPDALGSPWRVDAYLGHETQTASPYYGIGDATVHDPRLELAPNAKYYRFGRQRLTFTTNVQRRLGDTPLRLLLGVGAARATARDLPDGTVTTFLHTELQGAPPPKGWSNYARAGLVWDTRDREVHTRRGSWVDLLVQRFDKSLGSDWNYTRSTLTLRQYVPLSPTVTLAERLVAQDVAGDAPFFDLAVVQTSFKPQEGLGGSYTLRGLPKDRYVGKGLAVSNTELRWRAAEFALLGRPSTLTASAFVDAGRVWSDGFDLATIGSGLHAGYGGGIHVGRGPNFVVSLDIGHSAESAASVYVGIGFLF